MTPYTLTKAQLQNDLYKAYFEARKHKRSKPYQIRFEKGLEENISALCEDLWSRTYKPMPSQCFIISDPKKREVFAADFRDRIVHHLYYNYVHEMFERTFIQDSYSCIKHRGTHYGIKRMEMHIRQESQNYTVPCYVLKLDVRGYFMHINRRILLQIAQDSLDKMSRHLISKHGVKKWGEVVDMDFVHYLTSELILLNPIKDCRMIGSPADWEGLPADKSLFNSCEDAGLPIGNLTSQLFSNVYMNVFDQYVKRELRCRHYGRYVDDSYIVSSDMRFLHSIIPKVRNFLLNQLGLYLHEGKLAICDVRQGVGFLGAYIKPGRKYIHNSCIQRMKKKITILETVENPALLLSSINSFLGVLSHYRTKRMQQRLFYSINNVWKFGFYLKTKDKLKYVLSI